MVVSNSNCNYYMYCKNKCCVLYCKKILPRFGPWEKHTGNTAGICVVDKINKSILIVRSSTNRWSLPKGMVEPGEAPVDAAIRELREETGIETDKKALLHNPVYKDENCIYFTLFLDKYQTYLTLSESPEITGMGWIDIDCIVDSPFFKRFTTVTKDIVRKLVKCKLSPGRGSWVGLLARI